MCEDQQVQCIFINCVLEILTNLNHMYFHTIIIQALFAFICMHPTISALSSQMTEHYWTPQSNVSNETSTNKTFQRTISAQVHTRLHSSVKTAPMKPVDCCLFSALCWDLVPLLVFISNSAGYLGVCHGALKRKGAIWEQQRL